MKSFLLGEHSPKYRWDHFPQRNVLNIFCIMYWYLKAGGFHLWGSHMAAVWEFLWVPLMQGGPALVRIKNPVPALCGIIVDAKFASRITLLPFNSFLQNTKLSLFCFW